MNKARLLLLIIGLSLLNGSMCMHPSTLRITEIPDAELYQIPSHYYDYASIIPPDVDPYEWLGDLKWDQEYQTTVWDCSKMAAYLEWVLKNAGIPTKIYAGYGHAWLLIFRFDKSEWWAYECVELQWIPPWAEGRYYNPALEWDSIYELKRWFGHHPYSFSHEFCWWAEAGEPRLEED